jgi:hypothetical protein
MAASRCDLTYATGSYRCCTLQLSLLQRDGHQELNAPITASALRTALPTRSADEAAPLGRNVLSISRVTLASFSDAQNVDPTRHRETPMTSGIPLAGGVVVASSAICTESTSVCTRRASLPCMAMMQPNRANPCGPHVLFFFSLSLRWPTVACPNRWDLSCAVTSSLSFERHQETLCLLSFYYTAPSFMNF